MKVINFFLLSLLLIIFSSCSTVKKGFESQRKNSTDEFLVEKKRPLVMPPDYNQLPIPKEENFDKTIDENNIKSLITKKKNEEIKEKKQTNDKTFEDLLLKKIKNN